MDQILCIYAVRLALIIKMLSTTMRKAELLPICNLESSLTVTFKVANWGLISVGCLLLAQIMGVLPCWIFRATRYRHRGRWHMSTHATAWWYQRILRPLWKAPIRFKYCVSTSGAPKTAKLHNVLGGSIWGHFWGQMMTDTIRPKFAADCAPNKICYYLSLFSCVQP